MDRRKHRALRETLPAIPVRQQRLQSSPNRENQFLALFGTFPLSAAPSPALPAVLVFWDVNIVQRYQKSISPAGTRDLTIKPFHTTHEQSRKRMPSPESVARDKKKIIELWKITKITENPVTSLHSRNQLRGLTAGLENCAWGRD